MGKFRVRVSAKGKRWKKGQSSNSNPTTTKFRDAAKSRFFHETIGNSNLTQDALKKHDAFSGVTERAVDSQETESQKLDSIEDGLSQISFGKTFKTFDTFASDWSCCSNKSFSKLLNNFRSDSAAQKEMLAVLAAVTEVIKEKGGKESSTEYFAALMTALDAEDNDDSAIYAILTLISMGIKTVPQPVLQVQFAACTKTLLNLLSRYAQSDNVAILRPILGCLSVLLRAQEAAVWNDHTTIQVLDSILAFITFQKPKVRKAAQHGIVVIANASNINQKGLSHLASQCHSRLIDSVTTGGTTTTLHVLSLMKDIMHKFPKKNIKEACESVLKVMTLNNVLLSTCAMQTLHGMFKNRPDVASLPAERNARLITALYDFQPAHSDVQPSQAWLAVMQESYLNLAVNDVNLFLMNLPRLVSVATSLYLSDVAELSVSVTHCLETVLREGLGHSNEDEPNIKLNKIGPNGRVLVDRIASTLQSCLGFQYHNSWTHVLHLMAALFVACGKDFADLFKSSIRMLGELRDSNQFAYNNEVEFAIGKAIRAFGPEAVLQAFPFTVSPDDRKKEFKRSWILPVLKVNIREAPLKFFIDYFLPQTILCRNESDKLKKLNDQIGALSFDLLHSQIWALLPSFCTKPTDLPTSFPLLAKALGGVLNTRKDFRGQVMGGIRKLVTFALESSDESNIQVMSRFAKNYLPIFFNIYTTQATGSDEEGVRSAALETIKVYLQITESSLCEEMYKKAYEKARNPDTEGFMKDAVLALVRAMLPYQSLETINALFNDISGFLKPDSQHQVKDAREQKKYYKMLEDICTSSSPACVEFLEGNVKGISALVFDSLSSTKASSKSARIRCLAEILKRTDDPSGFIKVILPETILCVKDLNSKCRELAYNLLKLMADCMDPTEFIELIMAGLAGSTNLVSCSILSLAAVVFHYREKIPPEVEEQILYNVGVLLICSTREIVTAALSFTKVYLQSYPREKVAVYVPKLMVVLSKMTEDCKRHSRTKIRDLLARLVRWYGADTVLGVTPTHDVVLRTRIKNLGKIHGKIKKTKQEEREKLKAAKEAQENDFALVKRPKSIEEILAESDSELEDENEQQDQKKKGRNKLKTWISESPDEIVDFTDKSATQKITASNPLNKKMVLTQFDKKKSKKENAFKKAPDGRLIITDHSDSDDEESGERKAKSFLKLGLEDSEDDYQPSDEEMRSDDGGDVQVGRKRSLSMSTVNSGPANKYQAGGSGIHRPITNIIAKDKKRKQRRPGPQASMGTEYKSKKAPGDIKRKGLPDPYAYVPLRRDALNRRKRMKQTGQFRSLVEGARKGVKKGKIQKRNMKL